MTAVVWPLIGAYLEPIFKRCPSHLGASMITWAAVTPTWRCVVVVLKRDRNLARISVVFRSVRAWAQDPDAALGFAPGKSRRQAGRLGATGSSKCFARGIICRHGFEPGYIVEKLNKRGGRTCLSVSGRFCKAGPE
jgi:hypothetical protein